MQTVSISTNVLFLDRKKRERGRQNSHSIQTILNTVYIRGTNIIFHMNDGTTYETVSVRFSEDKDRSTMEEVCIEFLHQGTHVSILLNGIDRTDILKRLLAFESMWRPVKLLAYKLEEIFNKSEYNALPQLLLKGLLGVNNFHSIQVFGDADITREINLLSASIEHRGSLDFDNKASTQCLTFRSIIVALKNRLTN